jgi:GT2 family glycosyltransferase
VRATVIIPFHRSLAHLAQSLPAARTSMPDAEILVAADGAMEDCRPLAAASNARVVEVPGPAGPATARNRAAAEASGDVLLFVDADVVAAPSALAGMCRRLEQEPEIAAIFGAYGHQPAAPNFMSQYRNLAHAYVHETGNPEAATFWAGLGAIRRTVFHQVGGFDERFRRPSVEDIDLGYRVRRAGHRIRLDPAFRGEHLRRWTVTNSIVTDIVARGVPWTQLILKYGALDDDLNTRQALRWAVVATYVLAAAVVATVARPWAAFAAVAALAALVGINRRQWAWLAARRGPAFATRAFAAQLLQHACNGVSLPVGVALHYSARLGVRLPGALPLTSWPP